MVCVLKHYTFKKLKLWVLKKLLHKLRGLKMMGIMLLSLGFKKMNGVFFH